MRLVPPRPRTGFRSALAAPQRGASAVGALLLGLAAGTLAPTPATAAPSSPCRQPAVTTVATLGVWDPLNNNGRYTSHDSEVSGVATGLGRPGTSGGYPVVPAVRVQRRKDEISRVLLCKGHRLIARMPVPPDRRSRIVGLSVNGQKVAWRLIGSRNRGSLHVGTVRSGRVVGIRTTTNRTLDRARHYDGRIVVMPDGGTAWSLPQGRRQAGVWLWPAGERPRRVALANPMITTSWDVRIVGRHHVLLGAADRIARYGPRTPGRCPTPQLARHYDAGPVRVVRIPTASIERQSVGWSSLLICDRAVGDYTRVLDYSFEDVGDGSGHTVDSSEPFEVAVTGRTVVVRSSGFSYGGGFSSSSVSATVVPLAGRERFATLASVVLRDDGQGPQPTGSTDTGWAIAPGAVAWARDLPYAQYAHHLTREIWLADALGPRLVGSYPIGLTSNPADAPALELSATSLAWTAGPVRRSVPVTPDAHTAIDRVALD